ncbi:L-aminoadipate-semialdehyde dehydrogenase-phosphopantetheinyl transferase-like [Chlorella sorokiniana]|uniref:holo-[acyl-carrier-protein] synthase n=1 Tax=Chlorella sorokiniana TaxID=3076 RepID=A0A2P6TFM6_CHLSO|nr:L-aminoadipate-semialdehyde dehydrogenase-phosphopantetheinyl transferase-like [Chlorella sorokiniana]|eukprot:PRW32899.1 L-aminoadipate-semialdehyde dehydrogenase-phosphopantetheinyl transferase-like [Chlorella sorokiniana]
MSPTPARLRWAVALGAWEPSAPEFAFLLGLLAEEERAPVLRFRQEADQRRALVSRLMQRAAAAAALGLPAAGVVVRRTRGSKPYAANQLDKPHAPNWNYSVSHEGEYVILAAEPVCICGCDVAAPRTARPRRPGQPPEPLEAFFRSFEQQFTAREWESIRFAGSEAEQEGMFRKLWSLKEAFVKATGEGLGFELGLIEFQLDGSTASASVRGEPAEGWAFHLHELGQGHWVAVARAPLSAVVDAWGGFKATFQKTAFAPGEWQEQLHAPEPPFTMLSVGDLVPQDQRAAYAAAGGELL